MTVEDMFYALGIIDYMREKLIKRIDAEVLKKKGEKKHEKPDGKKTEK